MGQHFEDVLDVEQDALTWIHGLYPKVFTKLEMARTWLGRYGCTANQQSMKMRDLSDGQKARIVFAKLAMDKPHLLMLDEPTNHLDMESIDSLAKMINKFQGGLVLVSHDMRLISQVAKEIWICDNKQVTRYEGDISRFKMDMRSQMGIATHTGRAVLKGDASVKTTNKKPGKKPEPKLTVISNNKPKPESKLTVISNDKPKDAWGSDSEEGDTQETGSMSSFGTDSLQKNLPTTSRYVPPHLRNRN